MYLVEFYGKEIESEQLIRKIKTFVHVKIKFDILENLYNNYEIVLNLKVIEK